MNELEIILGKLAEASDKEVKRKLISEIGESNNGNNVAINILLGFLEKESDNEIKSYAADALAKIGGRRVVNQLLKLLKNDAWIIRMKAAETLGEIGNPKAISGLIRLLKTDTVGSVREWAAISLGKIKKRKASRALQSSMLGDKKWVV